MANGQVDKPQVLVIDEDLLFSVRIETTLKKLGYDVFVTGSPEEAMEIAGRQPLSLTILNFGRDDFKPLEVTAQLKALSQPSPILGFISHTLIPKVRPASREAGCDLLVANSALVSRLPQLVARLAPLDGSVAQIVEAEELAVEDEE